MKVLISDAVCENEHGCQPPVSINLSFSAILYWRAFYQWNTENSIDRKHSLTPIHTICFTFRQKLYQTVYEVIPWHLYWNEEPSVFVINQGWYGTFYWALYILVAAMCCYRWTPAEYYMLDLMVFKYFFNWEREGGRAEHAEQYQWAWPLLT